MQADKKPVVKVSFKSNTVYVFNSYEIKDQLKKLGFRFSWSNKAWYKTFSSSEELEKIAEELKPLGLEVPVSKRVDLINKLQQVLSLLREANEQLKEIRKEIRDELTPEEYDFYFMVAFECSHIRPVTRLGLTNSYGNRISASISDINALIRKLQNKQ